MQIPYGEIILRLVLTVVFSGIIGLERESHRKWAGFRTHILVGVGSALIMIISIYGAPISEGGSYRDPFRLAAQVVSGIGFLGAGTILHQGASVQGLTTAASLWVVAAIGLATGAGLFVPAVVVSVLAFLILTYVHKIEKILLHERYQTLVIEAVDRPSLLGNIGNILGDMDVNIVNVEMNSIDRDSDECMIRIEMELDVPRSFNAGGMLEKLANLEGIITTVLK